MPSHEAKCIGLLQCSLSGVPTSALPYLLNTKSTHWVSLHPSSNRLIASIPTLDIAVGTLPHALGRLLSKYISVSTSFGPAGGCSKNITEETSPVLFIEAVLNVDVKETTHFNLALLLFSWGRNISLICEDLIQAFIPLKRPVRYDPSRHNTIPLANLASHLTVLPSTYSHIHQDANLLEIPSGCDLNPVYPPPEIVKTTLLPHQAQGLAFLLDRESPQSASALALWRQIETDECVMMENKIGGTTLAFSNAEYTIETPLGSILADDMGLGKTIQSISIIASTLGNAARQALNPTHESSKPLHQATLVICPPRLLENWSQEIFKHTTEGSMKHLIYHGRSRRSISQNQIDKADIIITTYNLVVTEFAHSVNKGDPSSSLLFKYEWYRIILDEAHNVRNTNAKIFTAMMKITTKRRLCLTGTPVQNSLQDLLSLLSFLCNDLQEEHSNWPMTLLPHLKLGNFQPIQMVLRHTTLRRTKQDQLANLPKITHHFIEAPLTPAAEAYYTTLYDAFISKYQNDIPMNSLGPKRRTLLSEIGQLCGACNHPLLANPDLIFNDNYFEVPTPSPSLQALNPTSETIIHRINSDLCLQSSKITKLIEMIKPSSRIVANSNKVVVFSCWTRFLDLIEMALKDHGIDTFRLDGGLNANSQVQLLKEFETSQTKYILLASIQAAGVGINITAANVVFIMEPRWNPTTQSQAIDRLHRLGQTKPVEVYYMISPDTIEENIQKIQKRKRQLAESLVLTTRDWREIFQLLTEED